ncbi:unnamed protein product [Cuscuta europaea]|uniref:Uncharacterized protein n=1 Tax=Cuscuta europaea TaxID=41803 RepID=A0A9P1E407_CUSEU|nr:unnamed protein product [Cuscuta europaea]
MSTSNKKDLICSILYNVVHGQYSFKRGFCISRSRRRKSNTSRFVTMVERSIKELPYFKHYRFIAKQVLSCPVSIMGKFRVNNPRTLRQSQFKCKCASEIGKDRAYARQPEMETISTIIRDFFSDDGTTNIEEHQE